MRGFVGSKKKDDRGLLRIQSSLPPHPFPAFFFFINLLSLYQSILCLVCSYQLRTCGLTIFGRFAGLPQMCIVCGFVICGADPDFFAICVTTFFGLQTQICKNIIFLLKNRGLKCSDSNLCKKISANKPWAEF